MTEISCFKVELMFTCWCWEGSDFPRQNCTTSKFSSQYLWYRNRSTRFWSQTHWFRSHSGCVHSSKSYIQIEKFGEISSRCPAEKLVNQIYEIRQLCVHALLSCVRKSWEGRSKSVEARRHWVIGHMQKFANIAWRRFRYEVNQARAWRRLSRENLVCAEQYSYFGASMSALYPELHMPPLFRSSVNQKICLMNKRNLHSRMT